MNPRFKNEKLPANYELMKHPHAIENGKINFPNKTPDETYSFVIKNDGSFHIVPSTQGMHYILSDGAKSVRGAGQIKFAKDGSINAINNNSGHYGTGLNKSKRYTDNIIDSFEEAGLITPEKMQGVNQANDFN